MFASVYRASSRSSAAQSGNVPHFAALRARLPSRCRSDHNLAPQSTSEASLAGDAQPGSREEHAGRGFGLWNVELAGFVELREERERSDRIVVRLEPTDGARLNEPLERVRVSVRKGTAPAVGSFVEFKAGLSPPLEPLRPGGYDFARDMYFQSIVG